MKDISEKEIIKKIQLENPWWDESASIDEYFRKMKPRAYLESFYKLATERDVQRALVLMGPRRVGKTVMIYHAIQRLIDEGADPKKICYISIEAPVYLGLGLEQLLQYYSGIFKHNNLKGCYVFFDEIQYLKNWEVHLKKLVDDYRGVKFIASGSAAAALKLKSIESGAGRFTDFILPPLSFYEYFLLAGKRPPFKVRPSLKGHERPDFSKFTAVDIGGLNREFVKYLNFGGYPEALTSPAIQQDPGRFIRSDIIDKVLLRDLPSLYGIDDVQELYRLFTMLAYNTGNELSLDSLSTGSGISKNTIKKYLEYLEAAFLIKILHRVDQSGRRFKRANFFKLYLTNPAMRCALFDPVTTEHESMGNMVETAIVGQWMHSGRHHRNLYYARWKNGEVDLVYLSHDKAVWCYEIKWSDRYYERPEELRSLIHFAKRHNLDFGYVFTTTIEKHGTKDVEGIQLTFVESSIECYMTGQYLLEYLPAVRAI